jgi:hypothetical protein
MKEQENLEADYARRSHRELQEQRLHERRRQQAIAKRQKMLREWKKQQQSMHQQKVEEHDDENHDIDISRGSDGNLYFIKRLPSPQQEHRLSRNIPKNCRSSREFYPAPIGEEESVTESGHGYELLESDVYAHIDRTRTNSDTAPNNLGKNPRQQQSKHPYRKRSKQRITVTVEDASDSDCENEFDSPWRNRRPSPGQWIEPVESYCE